MEKIRLGRTNLQVSRSGFGAIPIQRISFSESDRLLQKAYAEGINFFDTARSLVTVRKKSAMLWEMYGKRLLLRPRRRAKTVDQLCGI